MKVVSKHPELDVPWPTNSVIFEQSRDWGLKHFSGSAAFFAGALWMRDLLQKYYLDSLREMKKRRRSQDVFGSYIKEYEEIIKK